MATMGFGFGVFLLYSRINSAALSSASPPISPITMMPSVSSCSKNSFSPSTSVVPASISPPIPTTMLCPRPTLSTALGDDAHLAPFVLLIRHNANPALFRRDDARTVGPNQSGFRLCSQDLVNAQHIMYGDVLGHGNNEGTSASIASRIAWAANGAGTKTDVACGFTSSIA
ncbi:unnamed protein product [Parascedosporium putredinis]|uniref:Uncharacterized protein n=1 Tax=Parascedosporium putredinis TaxID=1442378 RepID=A0A9P1MAB9_9PEZI|nr:unnamed protein product [Parascedosporium putredinis]CAI7993772.1 unnamed protein product [Parascedosporium putredinis]